MGYTSESIITHLFSTASDEQIQRLVLDAVRGALVDEPELRAELRRLSRSPDAVSDKLRDAIAEADSAAATPLDGQGIHAWRR